MAVEGHASGWRSLSGQERFLNLFNHYETSDGFANAANVSTAKIRSILNAVLAGKNTPSLDSPEMRTAMRTARHRMTDQIRRIDERAQRGQYVAPVLRSDFNRVIPQRTVHRLPDGQVITSTWISYRVEFLPDAEIFAMAKHLYSVFLDTGQFNMFRFTYLCQADYYSGGATFRDRELREASEKLEFIKISTNYIPFEMSGGNPDQFELDFMDEWSEIMLRGGERIIELAFRHDSDVEKIIPLVRRDHERWKKRNAAKKAKRGKGKTR